MADEKRRFPMLPLGHWWALRRKFKQSIPGVVTDNYVATVLDMKVESARANVLPFLKMMGIIDEDGKTAERARLWRDDEHYPEVCRAILKEIYPQELLDAVQNPKADRTKTQRWFANHTGVGEAASSRMAALYTVLVNADPTGDVTPTKEREPPRPAKGRAPQPRSNKREQEQTPSKPDTMAPVARPANGAPSAAPGIAINVQIHISADASSDQIEQIFASMAKHIYRTA